MEAVDDLESLKKDLNGFPWLVDARMRRDSDAMDIDKYKAIIPPGSNIIPQRYLVGIVVN